MGKKKRQKIRNYFQLLLKSRIQHLNQAVVVIQTQLSCIFLNLQSVARLGQRVLLLIKLM